MTRDALDTAAGLRRRAAVGVAILLMLGLVMVYSTSIALLEQKGNTGAGPTYYLVRHAISWCIAGVMAR